MHIWLVVAQLKLWSSDSRVLCEKDPSCLSILNLKVDQNKVQKIEFDEGSVGVLVLLSKAQGRVVGNPREIMSAKPSKNLNSLFVLNKNTLTYQFVSLKKKKKLKLDFEVPLYKASYIAITWRELLHNWSIIIKLSPP